MNRKLQVLRNARRCNLLWETPLECLFLFTHVLVQELRSAASASLDASRTEFKPSIQK